MESTDLKYNITGPTHRQGHTLDLILSREDENIVSDIRVLPSDNISDHSLITCILDCSRPPPSKLLVKYRDMKNLNTNRFVEEIKSSKLLTDPESNICNLTTQYNNTLSSLLEKYAPEKQRLVTLRPNSPWYDDELREEKRKKRRLERKYKSSGLEVFRQLFKEACKDYNVLIESAKLKYYQNLIENSDETKLFKMVDRMFIRKQCTLLPKHSTVESLAEQFNEYFVTKIEKLRSKLDCSLGVSPNITSGKKNMLVFFHGFYNSLKK